jgi:hypothetical protein
MKKLISLSTILNPDDSTFVSVSYVDEQDVLQHEELSPKQISDLLKSLKTILPDFEIVTK